jgi:hypothetical protein
MMQSLQELAIAHNNVTAETADRNVRQLSEPYRYTSNKLEARC